MKLIVTDSGSPNEGIPSTNYEVESPFDRKPEEQEDIKNVGLFQIHIEMTYEKFAVGKISSIWEWELDKMVQDSQQKEQEMEDLENLRRQDLERQFSQPNELEFEME